MFPQEIDQSPKTRYYRRIHTFLTQNFQRLILADTGVLGYCVTPCDGVS